MVDQHRADRISARFAPHPASRSGLAFGLLLAFLSALAGGPLAAVCNPVRASAAPAGAPAAPARYAEGNAVYQLVPVPVDDVVTIVTHLEFPGDDVQRAIDTFLLAGFAAEEGGVPEHLAVRWRRDGWFQLWTLGLDGAAGVLPSSLRPGSAPRPGMQSVTLEGGKFPQPGHLYETTLSYAPSTGYLAVSVVDVTAGEPFYRNVFQVNPVDRPVYGGAGVLLRAGAGEAAHPAGPAIERVLPALTPAGVRWRVIELEGENGWFSVTLLDRSKPLFIEVELGGGGRALSFPGELRFVARAPGDEEILLASLTGGAGTLRLPIQADRLPAGPLDIAMEYVQDGTVWLRDERRVYSGLIRVRTEGVEADPAAGMLRGTLAVEVDGAMAEFALRGRAEATARSLVAPSSHVFEVPLDHVIRPGPRPGVDRELDRGPAASIVQVQYVFPLPPEPHKWTIRLDVAVESPEGVRAHVEVPTSMSAITGSADARERVLAAVTEQYFEEFLSGGSLTLGFSPPREDGSWPDIDYADQSVSGWKAVPHLDRVLQMARAYAHPQSLQRRSERLRDEIARALRYWVENRFRNPNWWWNVIWQPQRLGDILLLTGDALPEELRAAALDIIRAEVRPSTADFTGANLVWNEGNRLRLGLVTQDLGTVAQAFETMASEVRVMGLGKEGIQVDGSFHQHGAMLYNGGYGESFAGDLVRFAHVARGTSLFPPEALSVLVDYILDGQQWMVRRTTFDFSTTGRVLTRQQTSGNASYLVGLVRALAAIPEAPRKEELDAFLARLLGGGAPLTGNRYFWTSDFMVHHRPEFYVSVKASSPRTLATEIGNYENLKGYHLGDGMMFIMRTGTEYDQTFPVWDWERLPGTTVRHMEHPLLVDGSWHAVRGAGDPSGGVSDGTYGAIAMSLRRDGASARKAWFFFDREVVALGAGVEAPRGATVTTSVNQARLIGNVIVGMGGATTVLAQGAPVVLDDPEWVYHDGVTYVFPLGGKVSAEAAVRTGRWSDVNSVYSNQLLSIPMFSLWFDHSGAGAAGGTDAYVYIVAPGVQASEAAAYAKEHGVAIIANDRSAQAVWHAGLRQLQAVFWQAGSVTAPSGLTVSVDSPALVIVREEGGAYAVTAGVLERKAGTVGVRIERAGACGGEAAAKDLGPQAAEGAFAFPDGDYLGRSVTQLLRPDCAAKGRSADR